VLLNFQENPLSRGVKYTAGEIYCDFRLKSQFTPRNGARSAHGCYKTLVQEVTGNQSLRVGSDDLE